MVDDQNLSRADYVYKWLRLSIRSGKFKLGDRLREVDLAEQLNVSRTPIREAIRRLISDGLVEGALSRGVMLIELDKQQVREMYALRASLEGTAARLAAQHASPGEIAVMRELLDKQSKALGKAEDLSRLDRHFHQTIHEAAHNRYLAQALLPLMDSLALLPGTVFQLSERGPLAIKEHTAIVRAIEARDADAAEKAGRRHFQSVLDMRLMMMMEAEERAAAGHR
ncbi:hypothetical protein UP09_05340 [Bradyrhizobium sp. LTSP885]|nr:hypothetical protein UP09_05340 [Bradyrhizobium sp. LTSP885]